VQPSRLFSREAVLRTARIVPGGQEMQPSLPDYGKLPETGRPSLSKIYKFYFFSF